MERLTRNIVIPSSAVVIRSKPQQKIEYNEEYCQVMIQVGNYGMLRLTGNKAVFEAIKRGAEIKFKTS